MQSKNLTKDKEDLGFNMQEIVIATSNPHKLEEIKLIANANDITFTLAPKEFNPIENGETFEENSFIKANCASKLTNKFSLADDTGLCVDYLNGAPGLHSARYANTQEEKINKLLSELKNVPYDKRNAHFSCVMTLCDEEGKLIYQTTGRVDGHIVETAKGVNGFGYDPIFYIDNLNKTMAEMTIEEKNTLSHRAIALNKMIEFIKNNF